MAMPNFLIIGAAKAGTTSLYRYLGYHPEVYVSPVKEPSFFSLGSEALRRVPDPPSPIVSDLEAYQALFNGAASRAAGEASTIYLVDPGAAERIQSSAPETRLIVILRDPIDRLQSHYWMRVRDNREHRTIETAIDEELFSTPISPVGYIGRGLYAKQLRPYLERFDSSQLKIVLFDDLCDDPIGLIQDLLQFLGIRADGFSPDVSVRYNASGEPSHRALKPLFAKSIVTQALRRVLPDFIGRRAAEVQERWRTKALKKPPMPLEQRACLAALYREDVDELEDMIGRDLSGWLQ